MEGLPIDLNLLAKRKEIPKMIADLSYQDRDKALHYVRIWGEKRMPITPLHEELEMALKRVQRHGA